MASAREISLMRRSGACRTYLRIRDYGPSDLDGFSDLYIKVFAEPPWLERWNKSQVKKEVDGYLLRPLLSFIVAEDSSIVGFSVTYQVDYNAPWFPKEVVSILHEEKTPIIYGNELAVSSQYRGMGLGTELMNERVEALKRSLPNGFVLIGRTDKDSKMVPVYQKLAYINTGFKDPKYETRYYWMRRF